MAKRKKMWLLNLLIVFALIVCALLFVIHYQNWIRLEEDRFKILTGIYYRDIGLDEIDSLQWVDKVPSLERDHGFSAWVTEKGIFKDSLNPWRKVHIFVDDLSQKKIKFVYRDSMVLYFNMKDSTRTVELFQKLEEGSKQFLEKN